MSEVKTLCRKSLEASKLGTGKSEVQNGLDIYKYIFGNYPDLRSYFKGAENFTPDDVQKSARFERLGTGLNLAVHVLVDTFDDQEVFKAYCRDTINRHVDRKLDPTLWLVFWTVFVGYLKTKTTVDDKTEKAWLELGKKFSDECLAHLASLGLPH